LNLKAKFFVLVVVSSAIFSVPGAVPALEKATATKSESAGRAAPAQVAPDASLKANDLIFEGCWNFFPTGACRAIYRDSQGDYFICGACDKSGTPSSEACSPISPQTLQSGRWCS
jgi:hypothetical protein